MLDAAEAHLGADGTLTLDSAARAAGVTKPGLMYHFATKEQLLSAILERITARYEAGMVARVGDSDLAPSRAAQLEFAAAPAPSRHLAYLEWACQAPLSPADLVIFADPHLRVRLTERWQDQLERWLTVPADVPRARRNRLLAVRLMADGVWFDRASGLLEISSPQVPALRALAEEILGGAW